MDKTVVFVDILLYTSDYHERRGNWANKKKTQKPFLGDSGTYCTCMFTALRRTVARRCDCAMETGEVIFWCNISPLRTTLISVGKVL